MSLLYEAKTASGDMYVVPGKAFQTPGEEYDPWFDSIVTEINVDTDTVKVCKIDMKCGLLTRPHYKLISVCETAGKTVAAAGSYRLEQGKEPVVVACFFFTDGTYAGTIL